MRSSSKILLAILLLNVVSLFAQINEPVKWKTSVEEIGDNEFYLIMDATTDAGWYVYAQEVEEGGPIPTTFDFSEATGVQLVGKVQEIGKAKEGIDPIFETFVKKYTDHVTFKAKVKTTDPSVKFELPVLYMSCNDEGCVRLEEYFDFTLKTTKTGAKPTPDKKIETGKKDEKSPKSTTTTFTPKPKTPVQETKHTPEETKVRSGKTETVNNTQPTKKDEPTTKEDAGTVSKDSEVAAETDTKTKDDKADEEDAESETTASTDATNVLNATTTNNSGLVDPIKWTYSIKDLGNGEHAFTATATLDDGWYIYSATNPEGPIPTTFAIDSNDLAKVELLSEKPEEVSEHKKSGYDSVFEVDITKYSESVDFVQKLKFKDPNAQVAGSMYFQVCDDEKCLRPTTEEFFISPTGVATESALGGTPPPPPSGKYHIEECGLIAQCGNGIKGEGDTSGRSGWMIFLLGFLGGFAALLTPCVFPMIPLTVSFFTKRSKDKKQGIRNAFIYALSIIVIYVSLGLSVTIMFGSDALNAMSTDPWFNLFFFALFALFAFSFFGYFELTLPSSLINKMDEASDRGGLIGIFFMAFTLALVSFSCTGPIIGTLLVDAALGGARLGPALGMFGFAFALALPFALFAAFPGWLNSLPRSGGWLNTVKVVLGFIELIFALKFLSNADLVQQWGLLKRETFLIIWIILFAAMALYLFGKIKFPHDSPIKKLAKSRIALGVMSLAFAIYLVPGIFCQSLSLVSGFPPPIFYSYGCGSEEAMHANGHFEGMKDFKEGLAEAKRTGKPLLVDFTGWACVNCRKMEENVWPTAPVAPLIDEYVLVSLYVDEDIALPKDEQFEYFVNGKKYKVKTVGNKWSYFQFTCFNTNTQPYYVLLNGEGEQLAPPVGYTPNNLQYANFLEGGLGNYKAGKALTSRE